MAGAAEANPGDLDPTFGSGGLVTTDFGGTSSTAKGLLRQPDGKLVAAGSNGHFALARYNPDGTLDGTFGSGGRVAIPISCADGASALVRRPDDGKLVVAGTANCTTNPSFPNLLFELSRYNVDGTLDEAWGGGGRVFTDFGSHFNQSYALLLQPDAKLVAAGLALVGADYDFALVRHDENSFPDNAGFGSSGNGQVTTDFGSTDLAYALALQPDGKVVAAGYTFTETYDFALARYHPDGTLDGTFGSGGLVTTDLGGSEAAHALALQPDGKLVAAGSGSGDFVLARYNPDGTLDGTFGRGGLVRTDFGGASDLAFAVVLQPDSKLVVAGSSGGEFALARYEGSVCGNGLLEASEQCDDGNRADGDCCSSACQDVRD